MTLITQITRLTFCDLLDIWFIFTLSTAGLKINVVGEISRKKEMLTPSDSSALLVFAVQSVPRV